MTVKDIQQKTLDLGFMLLGTRQQGVPVILKELMLPDGFDSMSPSFTARDVTTELSGPQLAFCRTYKFIDHCVVVVTVMHIRSFLV
ncbi:unnamed protein product [Schistosoma mattheei]|uniref:Uncharacterized protein n=1 Tax=Schistosoma mattheei TaxID=31246 RepID=A0A183Q2F0_9TREM|nr:unnamed protein product [Schistosoma mattheei]